MRPVRVPVVVGVTLVSVLVSVLVSCSARDSAPGAGESPANSPAATAAGEPVPRLDWQGCGSGLGAAGLECATADVPLDHADPTGPAISLALARRPARDPGNRIGSLFVNPGGPGASGIDFVEADPVSPTLADRFDVVSWDPRGVGGSTPLDCGQHVEAYRALDWSPDDEQEAEALAAGAKAIADDCAGRSADLLRHLSTDDTARDLELLRRAVGDDGLSYLGFSYGTAIGLRYAELFPGTIRALVLDGVVDPTEDLEDSLAGQTEAIDGELTKVLADCDASTSCPVKNAGATYDRLALQAEQAPLGSGSSRVGPTALAYAAVSASYDASSAPVLLRGLAQAEQGNGANLLGLADRYWSAGSYTAYLGVLCTDLPHPQGADFATLAEHLRARSSRLGDAIANELLPCAYWPAPTTGRPAPVHAAGSPPILVVGNTGDAATPYASAQRVAADLDQGVLLTYDGEGHTSYGRATCVTRAVDHYLTDRADPAAGTTCS